MSDDPVVAEQEGTPSAASPAESLHSGRGTWDLKTWQPSTRVTQSLCASCTQALKVSLRSTGDWVLATKFRQK
jgi:hypothetical protein